MRLASVLNGLGGLVAMAGVLVAGVGVSTAHPPTILTGPAERAISEEVLAFRKSMAEVIARKDVSALRKMYFDGFVHTHTSGKQDGKDARIVSGLAGDPVIETAAATEMVVRAPNDWT
ncbi:MAG TPA: hypothetical protein PK264_03980, partial [Hyphomicrobiaceae bacterium]|nr:hypothetical protein [Hyphomicrobiaceae bacterium]